MIRTLMAAAAVSGLMLCTALAETSGNPRQDSAMTGASQRGANAQVITQQSPSQWLGSKLIGTGVLGPDNEKIGAVSDVLIDKNGKVDALVVGVGGFLGIGAKDIALPMAVFEVVPANSSGNNTVWDQFRLPMTKDQLQQHAEFKSLGIRSDTTGSGSRDRSGSGANDSGANDSGANMDLPASGPPR